MYFQKVFSTVNEIKTAIKEGHYDVNVSPCLKDKVKAARMVKKVLKKQLLSA